MQTVLDSADLDNQVTMPCNINLAQNDNAQLSEVASKADPNKAAANPIDKQQT